MNELKQAIYHHGGSRIYYEADDEKRYLIADTYLQDKDFAMYMMDCARTFLEKKGDEATDLIRKD